MMELKTDKLDNLLDTLIDYRGKTPKKTGSGIPLVTAKIIKNGVINEFSEYIAEEDYDKWMVRGFPRAGDVVLTTEAPLGEVAQLDDRKIALAQRVVCLRGKSSILDNTYLKYYFLSNYGKKMLKSKESGTTVTGIKQSELRNVEVRYPSFDNQRRIASILSSLDDKIAINRRICENLEAQAQALFKHWFIDFAPFKNGKFVESELGMIPLSEISEQITDGVHNSVKDEPNSNYMLLSCKNIVGGVLSKNSYRSISKSTFESLRLRTKLAKGDVLLSSVGTIGEIAIVEEEPINYEFQRSVAIVKPKKIIGTYFLYNALLASKVRLQHAAHGAVQQCLFIGDLKKFEVFCCDTEKAFRYNETVKPLFEKIANLHQENLRLSALRDTLLPKLMSGEIKV